MTTEKSFNRWRMLSELMRWLEETTELPGMGLAQYISFRTLMAAFTAGLVGLLIGGPLIRWLRKNALGEQIRSEGPATHAGKRGTPTMGGLMILFSLAVGALLWADLSSAYLWALLGLALWLGTIGFIDDWVKRTRSKKGMSPRIKLLGQIGGALWLTVLMLVEPSFYSTRERVRPNGRIRLSPLLAEVGFQRGDKLLTVEERPFVWREQRFQPVSEGGQAPTFYSVERKGQTLRVDIPADKAAAVSAELFGQARPETIFLTNLPFVKNQEIAYGQIGAWVAPFWLRAVFYGMVVLFILTATSNAFNLTDGLDGLAVGVGTAAFVSLASFAYFSSNRIWADYFMILYLPHAAEVTVFAGAVVGACIAFLWYNAYPAQIFMGDTGSLMLGGLIGAMAIMVKKELLLPLIAGIPFAETLSVMIQVAYFRYTKRKYGEGRRIFKMSPLHHHFELSGWHEVKVVIRFWIVALLTNALAFITLKLR